MNNPFSVLSQEDDSSEMVDSQFQFKSIVPDAKLKLPQQPFHEIVDRKTRKTLFSQLTCSSKYGYFVAAGESGFICGKTEDLYDTIYKGEKGNTVSFDNCFQIPVKEGGVKFLALSHDERQLIVGVTQGILLIYYISDVVKNREHTVPVRSISLGDEILSVHPNPEFYPDVVGICVQNSGCKLVQISTGQIIHTIPFATSASWSPKGKQIVCGNKEGGIRAFDIKGETKDDIPPPSAATNLEVKALLWAENHVFFVIYGTTELLDAEHYPYIVNRKESEPEKRYQPLGEITPIYNSENADNQFYLSIIRDFGDELKSIVIVANAIASDFAVVAQKTDNTWQTWEFDEGQIPSLPLSESNLEDTFPVGITVDFSASKPLPPFDASESDTPVPPMPMFLFLTNEGHICAYHIYCNSLARQTKSYSGMVSAEDVFTIQPPTDNPTDFSQPSSTTASQQPVVGAFGAALNSTNNTPSFGSLGGAKIPSFSAMRTTAPGIKPSASGFGSTLPQQSAFGSNAFGSTGPGMAQTSSFASLAKTSTQTGSIGSSGFGNPSAFGSTSSFGKTDTPKSAFGSTSSFGKTDTPKSAFGSVSSFGNTETPKPGFGSASSWGDASVSDPAFGKSTPFGTFKNPSLGTEPSVSQSTTESEKKNALDFMPEKKAETSRSGFSGTSANSKYATQDPIQLKKPNESSEEENLQSDEIQPEHTINNFTQPTTRDIVETKQEATEEDTKQKKAEEEARLKQAEEDSRQKQAEEEARRKQAEEEARRKQAEEEARRKQAEEEAKQKQVEEEARKRQAEEEAKQKQAEEEDKIQQQLDSAKLKTIERPVRHEITPRFAQLPKTAEEKTRAPRVSTAEHEMSKEFENIYFEVQDSIEATCAALSDIRKDINFHRIEDSQLKQEEYLSNADHIWKRGDTNSISHILVRLNQSVPECADEVADLLTSLTNLCGSVHYLVMQAERLNTIYSKEVVDGKDRLSAEDLEEISDISAKIRYTEFLKISETKTNSFQSTFVKCESLIEELKRRLSLIPVPNASEKKLTTYTLRHLIRDCTITLRSAENRIKSLEDKLQSIRKDSKEQKNEDVSSAQSDETLQLQMQTQSFFSELFNYSQERTPLSNTCV
ncbi:hypothetical protein BY458DRAFT_431144 [Sporodiniella umbellata]|nr:hypothetical protein BY458DRAFT_431144 [Sporodiniella umbellata]